MSAEESFDIESPDGQNAGPGLPGQRPPSSGVGKVIFGLALLLIVAGAVVFRGITTRARAAADVKADTRDLSCPRFRWLNPSEARRGKKSYCQGTSRPSSTRRFMRVRAAI